jgi:hypothetical protein
VPTCLSDARLVVCTGKDCRRDKGYDRLVEIAERSPGAVGVPCQGLCDGPIAAVKVKGEWRWYDRARGGAVRRALVEAARRGKAGKVLRGREITKRRGAVRGAARAKLLTR